MSKIASANLRCRHGRWELGEFALRNFPGEGVATVCACDLGDHYLQPDPAAPHRLVSMCSVYLWPTAHEALEKIEQYKQQEG